ncbi:MAG: nucleotidyltransferase family protein, partial [Microcoleaceae cyanobacterium]
ELVWEGKYDEYGDRREVDIAGYVMPIQQVYQRLNITPEKLAAFCEKWQIVELALFGSILRDDFKVNGEDQSDIDILYTLAELSNHSLFEVMNMREELENLCQRKVDFVSRNAIQGSRNWLRRQEILSSGMILYVQR